MTEALDSIYTILYKSYVKEYTCNSGALEVDAKESKVQGHSLWHNKIEVILRQMRSCLKREEKLTWVINNENSCLVIYLKY